MREDAKPEIQDPRRAVVDRLLFAARLHHGLAVEGEDNGSSGLLQKLRAAAEPTSK